MDHNSKSDNDPLPRDKTAQTKNRIDVSPPYNSPPTHAVEHFRRLLAELIARKMIAARREPPPDMAEE